ncbi:hypothetical protein CUJ89_18740 [Burkholderia pyrrocinia]|uniref:Uncharacterized protein n=1 Tax=Burkholderia pyrrocinia TaxID=60550 RepID=A0A2Z5N0I7_BURPY|nr:hypothetical protein CUJ89_18740 [Burkholderia pyrrocinia]
MNPLFYASSACGGEIRRPCGTGSVRTRERAHATGARGVAAGRPAAAAMVNGTGTRLKRNNENSFLPKSR